MFKNFLILFALLFHINAFAEKTREKISEVDQKQLLQVLKINEKLHGAFFSYDAKKVEDISKEMIDSIDKISNKQVQKKLNYSKKKLKEITADAKRKENNDNYHMVSMALIHLIKKYDLGKDYNVYSCPMVKMKWVQNSKKMDKVHNPYAPWMPHCGAKDTNY